MAQPFVLLGAAAAQLYLGASRHIGAVAVCPPDPDIFTQTSRCPWFSQLSLLMHTRGGGGGDPGHPNVNAVQGLTGLPPPGHGAASLSGKTFEKKQVHLSKMEKWT